MSDIFLARAPRDAIPIEPVRSSDFDDWLARQPAPVRRWIEPTGFRGNPGGFRLVPGDAGAIGRVVLGTGSETIWDYAALPRDLPAGAYRLVGRQSKRAATEAALGWALGTYRFARYRAPAKGPRARLAWPAGCDRDAATRMAAAIFLVRDLINTPAADMGPAELAAAARKLGKAHRARVTVTAGEALAKANYPAILAVGRGSARAPRLIDLRWGPAKAPRVTLVGKGVCFDSGGLDLKPAAGMRLMKKDMGGAAHVLGLAAMIMGAKLPIRLRVLIPAVENLPSGTAYRPLDVIRMRNGMTVEVGDTDAEGRLVLADALAEASREKPDLVIDFATLTGAARAALGTELPALFCNDDGLAAAYLDHGTGEGDPLWRLPLWDPYRRLLDSPTADLGSTGAGPHGGAITAALFLREFVGDGIPWAHIDLMAWNVAARPGRPEGGEAMALRATFALIAGRYGKGR
ncbi:MAG: leucyl aminopeptidase family protein [Alphaproteobacteria bacterium]